VRAGQSGDRLVGSPSHFARVRFFLWQFCPIIALNRISHMQLALTKRMNTANVLAHVVKRIEGTSDTWQLLRRDLFGEPYYYRLLTNAFSMSATNPYSQRYMRLFAYLPLAFRPESEDVLLISYGCGVTADAFLHGSHVKRMDAVESRKRFSRSPILIPASITRIRCVTRACTQLCRMAASFFKPARGSTTLSLASHLRRRCWVQLISTRRNFFR